VKRLAPAVFVLLLAVPAQAAAPSYVIRGDRSAGPLGLAQTTVTEAVERFGRPETQVAKPPYSCVLHWPRLRLTVDFLAFEGKACASGVAVVATVTGRTAWRTAVGLRVGDSLPRLRSLYPRATRPADAFASARGFWLVTRRACETVGAHAYPGLLARIRDGRVSALVLTAGVCE
jgi:hypothetical protein